MNLLSKGAYNYLVSRPEIAAMVEDGLLGSDSKYPAWVFRSQDGKPQRAIEGSGKCGIVISETGWWAIQNTHNTATFPILRVVIYADSTRDEFGVAKHLDAGDKCIAVFNRLKRVFHDPGKDITYFDTIRIHDIVMGSAFNIQELPDSDEETVFGQVMYNVSTD